MNALPETLLRHARERTEALALQAPDHTLTYAELYTTVKVLAERLLQTGLTRFGLCGDNSAGWILADLACRMAGVVCVPVPAFFSTSQWHHLIQSAGLQALLYGQPDDLPAADECASAERLWWTVFMTSVDPVGEADLLPEHTAKVTFTSGSTGTPRGVCLSAAHQDATVTALARRVGQQGIRRHLCLLPLATLLENVAGVYLPLMLGATVEVRPLAQLGLTGSSRLDVMSLIRSLQAVRPDSLILVPELAAVLVRAAERGALAGLNFRFLAVGGGRVSPRLLARAEAVGLPLFEGYGLSECASAVALNAPGDNRPGRVGRPLDHVRVSVSDRGEILVSGNTHLGYLGDHRPPAEPLRTGDLGHVDESGFLRVTGRSKNVLITSFGRNISPEWLESELVQALGARQALVFGDGERQPQALLVICDDRSLTEIRAGVARINAHLPDYARLARVAVLREPLLPRDGFVTGNGRLIRTAVMDSLDPLLARAALVDVPSHDHLQAALKA